MLSQEENDLLTRTGPGTPCGETLRRYWQPTALSEELPPDGPPLPVRLLGEDLVLFRDSLGRPGLLGIHCSHRGADLSYGRLEDGGLRGIYHGWLYDINGRCLEQPGEPAFRWTDSGAGSSPESSGSAAQATGGSFREKIKHRAYPCTEKNGLILSYLGPGEPPLLPDYEFFSVPEAHASVSKMFSECNFLQGNEGNIDLLHTSFLHYMKRDLASLPEAERRAAQERYAEPETLTGRGPSPGMERCEAQALPYGIRNAKIRTAGDGEEYVRLATFLLPNLTVIPGGSINWHVPIDDTHHWRFGLNFNRERPINRRGSSWAPAPEYKPHPDGSNRYLQDRELMAEQSYSGIPQIYFVAQDLCATESAGPIQDRTQEHLVANDIAITAARTLLRKAIQDVQEGKDPPHVVRDPGLNHFPEIISSFGMLPRGVSWKDYCAQLVAEGRSWQTRGQATTDSRTL
ncbi:MAG TPA: Rieske 2Fe-2S domain-containing protein [Chloroflexota bacterium]